MQCANKYKNSAVIACCWIVLIAPVQLASADHLPELLQKLQRGGYVLYMRHAATDHTQADAKQLVLTDCSTQRNLSAAGRQYASQVAQFFRNLQITFEKSIASPYCRTRETAELAFGESTTEPYLAFSAGQEQAKRQTSAVKLRRYLAQSPEKGKNRVVVGHTSNLLEATQVWPEPEGVIHIFEPVNGAQPRHIGFISPDDVQQWAEHQ